MALARSLGRRERNKIANRRQILRAALTVFSSIGYDASTITDIVKTSGLSVGTFYNYYGDKDSVFAELVSDLLTEARQALNDARHSATSIEEFVAGAFLAYGELLQANPGMNQLIAKNTHAFRRFVFGGGDIDGIISDLEKDMTLAIEQGLLPPFHVRLMTSAMIGAGLEVFSMEDQDTSMTPESKAEFLGNLFLGGIARLAREH
ncbi:MAG: TetR/AcrR family transcriptional regulator [Oleiphilaceae bacterium]|nr:TetR/AcrR family transcriptional regulator [Oleiphilaceae bacterium]